MVAKRKALETTPDPSPVPKRRAATRATATLVDVQALPNGSSTGLNGGYWGTPSKRTPRPTVSAAKEGSLKENASEMDGTSETSHDEDPLLLTPSKPHTSRAYERAALKANSAHASTPRGRATGKLSAKPHRQASAKTPSRPRVSSPVSPSIETEDSLPVVSQSKLLHRRARTKSQSPSKRARTTFLPEENVSSSQARRGRHDLIPTSVQTEDEEDALPSPPSSPSRQGRYSNGPDLTTSSRATKSLFGKKLTPPLEALPLTPASLPKKQASTTDASETEADTLPSIAKTPVASPRKQTRIAFSPVRLPRALPMRFHPCLMAQKIAVLRTLHSPPPLLQEDNDQEDEPSTNEIAYDQLKSLLSATMNRGEGNSCMLIGPRGSGKTHMVEQVLSELAQAEQVSEPIVIRLSGHVQQNDRLAMREIARQLVQQTGGTFLDPSADDEPDADETDVIEDAEENPFLGGYKADDSAPAVSVRLPPTAHLPSLISTLPTLGRPVIVVLDGFDLFALHARQALLYCLLDTVQHSQAAANGANYQPEQSASPSKGKRTAKATDGDVDIPKDAGPTSWSGLAVVGVSTRVDTLELLEKRVKSRFSGRILRTAAPGKWETWSNLLHRALGIQLPESASEKEDSSIFTQWADMWGTAVDKFLQDNAVNDVFRESVALIKDMRLVSRILVAMMIDLNPEQPWPTLAGLNKAVTAQRCPARFADLHKLHYPAVCLLIAAIHARTAGHEQVTFEQLHDDFRDQVRKSTAAPVQIEGGGIGMVRCSRGVLMGAFEQLVSAKIFIAAGPTATAGLGREFVKYRCVPDREDVKRAVEKIGQTNLKKWFSKAS